MQTKKKDKNYLKKIKIFQIKKQCGQGVVHFFIVKHYQTYVRENNFKFFIKTTPLPHRDFKTYVL